jgi:PAS domain S-box-containing protein
MNPADSIASILQYVQPRIQQARAHAGTAPPAWAGVFDEVVEELCVAVEELQATNEALAEGQTQHGQDEHEAKWFRALFDAYPAALLATDALGAIRAANPAASALLGPRPGDLRGKPLAVFVAEPGRRAFRVALTRLRDGGERQEIALRVQPRLANSLDVRATVSPLSVGGEAVLLWALRPAGAPAALARGEDEEVLRAMVRSLPVAAAAMDLDGTVLVWNRAAERLLGWTEEELAGRPNPALPPDAADLARGARPGDDDSATVAWLSAEAVRADGDTVAVEVVVAPLVDAAGRARGTVAVLSPAEAPADGAPREAARPAAARAGGADDVFRRLLAGSAQVPVLERLREGIAAGLHLGRLSPGDRLPSIREAARAAASDHRVISAAYQQLASEGLVVVQNRRGVTVAEPPRAAPPELGETAEWLARTLAEAAALQVKAPQLPELLRDWTARATVRCACVESTDDELAALCGELSAQWGLETEPVRIGEGALDAAARRALAEALREADVVVTTAFHARAVEPLAALLGRPLVVASMSPDVVQAVEERLRAGALTAVVADARWGERLRALPGGERLQVVRADDVAAVAALDPAEPVLLTRAAQQRIRTRPRLLVPTAHFVSPTCANEVARLLIRRNLDAARALN